MKTIQTVYGNFILENEYGDLVQNWLMVYKTWEPEVYSILETYLNKETSSIEVGSYIGDHTIYMGKLSKKVFSFEPFESSYNLLLKNIALNECDNIEVHQKAIYDGSKIRVGVYGTDLGIQAGNTASTRFVPDSNGDLQSYTLDAVVGLDTPISLIKTDAEGLDLYVIMSAEKIIEKYHPAILFEFNDGVALQYGHTIESYSDYLSKFGYTIKQLAEWNWLAIKE